MSFMLYDEHPLKKSKGKFTKEDVNGYLVEENKSRGLYRELLIFLQRIHNTYHGEI